MGGALFFVLRGRHDLMTSSPSPDVSESATTTQGHAQAEPSRLPPPGAGSTTGGQALVPADIQAENQWHLVQQILASHNDNDPRLDKELRVLDAATKARFRAEYKKIPPEKRNDRGTLVFLLGRNITEAQDLAFMKDVVNESPCLSLADCNHPEPSWDAKKEEHQNGMGVTLAYPQLVALQSLLNLAGNSNAALKEGALDVVSAAKHSSQLLVSRMADSVEAKLEKTSTH